MNILIYTYTHVYIDLKIPDEQTITYKIIISINQLFSQIVNCHLF